MENEQGEKNKPTFWRAPSIVKVKSVGILQVIWYVANVIISTIKKPQWAPLSLPQKRERYKKIKKWYACTGLKMFSKINLLSQPNTTLTLVGVTK